MAWSTASVWGKGKEAAVAIRKIRVRTQPAPPSAASNTQLPPGACATMILHGM